MIEDALEAVINYLQADTNVSGLVSTRVFGYELPRAETDSMPRKAVICKASGGASPTYTQGTVQIQAMRIDAFSYGETPYQAERVRRAVHSALRALSRTRQGTVLLHWAQSAGGPAHIRDTDADWPAVFQSWQVLADERTAA